MLRAVFELCCEGCCNGAQYLDELAVEVGEHWSSFTDVGVSQEVMAETSFSVGNKEF